MTRRPADGPEPGTDAADTDATATGTAGTDPRQVGEVLEQVRGEAVRLLDEVAQPRALRVQAGEVRVEVEWATAGQPAQPVGPAGPTPATGPVGSPDPAEAAEQVPDPGWIHVTSPAVGVFYRSPEPGADPFIAEGDTVSAGQQVAIVEAMKLMIAVEAEQPGRITKVFKDNGESVEYGEQLFAIEPEDAS